jgi:hypothetical protein
MLNVEWSASSPAGLPFNIEHSTLNIQHSVVTAEVARAAF